MTDDTTNAGTGNDGIEFNPPVPEIYGDGTVPPPRGEDQLTEKAPSDVTAEDVGLQLTPASRPTGAAANFKQILQDVKLPERRSERATPAAPPVTPRSAAPVGENAPELSPLQKDPAPEINELPGGAATVGRSSVVSLHTMKDDVQDAVREQQLSMVRAASLEIEKHAKVVPPTPKPPIITAPPPPKKKKHLFVPIMMTIAFFVLGGSALYAAYFFSVQKVTPIATSTGIIFAEQQSTLLLGAETVGTLKQTLGTMLSSQGSGGGSIMQVTPTVLGASGEAPRKATLQEFFHALGARPPEELLRALDNDFFFGIHAADVPSTIFIIPVAAFDHAFAGMLAWEATINTDLQPLFRQTPAYLPLIASSSVPARRAFQDYLIRNYDVRILRDDGGSIVLYYSFPTQGLLIIASSPYTFPEVLSRLQAQRKL